MLQQVNAQNLLESEASEYLHRNSTPRSSTRRKTCSSLVVLERMK